jgi:hypothetical protein
MTENIYWILQHLENRHPGNVGGYYMGEASPSGAIIENGIYTYVVTPGDDMAWSVGRYTAHAWAIGDEPLTLIERDTVLGVVALVATWYENDAIPATACPECGEDARELSHDNNGNAVCERCCAGCNDDGRPAREITVRIVFGSDATPPDAATLVELVRDQMSGELGDDGLFVADVALIPNDLVAIAHDLARTSDSEPGRIGIIDRHIASRGPNREALR